MKERMYLKTAKRLVEDLIDLKDRIEMERSTIETFDVNHDILLSCNREKLQLHKNMLDIYRKLNFEIYKHFKFMVESEINYLQCLDHDKPKNTDQSTVTQHNRTLASTCNSKQETCCNDKTTVVYGAGSAIDNRLPLHSDPYQVSTTTL